MAPRLGPANDPNGQTDASIDTEIAWDQEFAAANGLTNYSPAVVITGEHSGIENPNMPAALHNVASTSSPPTRHVSPSSTR